MYIVRNIWGKEELLDKRSVLEEIENKWINFPTLINLGDEYLLPEEYKEFRDANISKRKRRNGHYVKEAKILTVMYVLFFVFFLYQSMLTEYIDYILGSFIIVVAPSWYLAALNIKVVDMLESGNASQMSAYREQVFIESKKGVVANIVLSVSLIAAVYMSFFYYPIDNGVAEILYHLFKHNSLLHLLFNLGAIAYCTKIIEAKYGTVRALLMVIMAFGLALAWNEWLYSQHGFGLSSVGFSLAFIVLEFSRKLACKFLFFQLSGCVVLVFIGGFIISEYIDNISHTAGLAAGLIICLIFSTFGRIRLSLK